MSTTRLGDIIEGWPDGLGDTLEDLVGTPTEKVKAVLESVDADYASLVWALRGQARDLVRSSEREAALSSPQLVEAALRDGVLRPKPRTWIVYALDSKMRRVPAPHKGGGSRFVVDLRNKFPRPDDDVTPTEDGGAYLAVFGGGPTVFEIPGVAERICAFAAKQRLTDVVCWDSELRACWSLRFGVGQDPTGQLPFPSDPLVEKARSAWH